MINECEYCQGEKPLAIGLMNNDRGIAIRFPHRLAAYGYDVHGFGSNGIDASINFCPMCGKQINKFYMVKR